MGGVGSHVVDVVVDRQVVVAELSLQVGEPLIEFDAGDRTSSWYLHLLDHTVVEPAFQPGEEGLRRIVADREGGEALQRVSDLGDVLSAAEDFDAEIRDR